MQQPFCANLFYHLSFECEGFRLGLHFERNEAASNIFWNYHSVGMQSIFSHSHIQFPLSENNVDTSARAHIHTFTFITPNIQHTTHNTYLMIENAISSLV